MGAELAVSRDIGAPAEKVWDLVADLPRMGEWSPENEGGTWLHGATGPKPGAKFRGSNRNGTKSWKTLVTIVDADPGRALSFDVSVMGSKVSRWSYRLEPTASGCRVTETWQDHRHALLRVLSKGATGVADRESHNRAAMEQTLDRLAAAAESGAA